MFQGNLLPAISLNMKAVGSSKTTVNNYQTVSFEVVAAVKLMPQFFWDVALHHWVSALSLETSDVGHQVMQYYIRKEWRHQLPDFMKPHSRRWQSSGVIVFRAKCKNEGRSLQICYSKCVIIYLLASQHHLAETLVYVWEFMTVVSVAKCQEQNRLYTWCTSYSKSLAMMQTYLSSSSCTKCVAHPPLYLHFRLVEILAQSTDIPQLI